MNRWAITLLMCLLFAGRLTYAQAQPSAGIQAYAEAQPTFNYIEKDAGGQKVGEAHLKGHFEAAARLFLELAGAFFVDLDSPWWSPVGDDHWEWPFGSVVYPIGDEMGVGADVDWLVGSPEVPELTFSPVKFDPDKFLSDMTKDPDNLGEKGKGGDEKKDGAWTDEGGGSKEAQTTDPKADPKKENAPKEDLTKLDDNTKYMRALDEVGKIGDAAKGKGLGKGILSKKLKAIKAKYALQTIEMIDAKDESVKVLVRQKDKDNSTNPIEIKLLGKAELDKEFAEAVADLELKLKLFGDPKTGAVTKAQAETAANETDLHFEVIDGVTVTVDGDQLVIKGDVGVGVPKKMASKPLAKGMEPEAEGAETDTKGPDTAVASGEVVDVQPWWDILKVNFTDGAGENHKLFFEAGGSNKKMMMASTISEVEDNIADMDEETAKAAASAHEEYVEAQTFVLDQLFEKIKKTKDEAKRDGFSKQYKELSKTVIHRIELLSKLIIKNAGMHPDDFEKLLPEKADFKEYPEDEKSKKVTGELITHHNAFTGSAPASPSSVKGWDEIVRYGLNNHWVQMHLISERIGGVGKMGKLGAWPKNQSIPRWTTTMRNIRRRYWAPKPMG